MNQSIFALFKGLRMQPRLHLSYSLERVSPPPHFERLPAEVANILIKAEEGSPSPPLINSLRSVDGNLAAPQRRRQTLQGEIGGGEPGRVPFHCEPSSIPPMSLTCAR